ncbi:MarR family winged helix-turn-helix transcriptional regulator [Mesorhizobium sp. ANAO-SY3R2]|uniref:MarR family winged helix-turn-helix transcriptional regulator n=1 Tax=Mesorhizobium sp. ANAO-SY3R2 TaxID=3166644 RepID=UPI00367263C7
MKSEGTDRLGFLIHDAARLMRRSFEQRASDFGLSAAQWRLLVRLIKEEGMAQARLAELLEIEPISVSRLLDRMEEGHWVERRQAAHDRRVRMVFPTDKTRDVYAKIKAVAGEVYEHALSGLSPAERQAMIHGLRVMVENLSAGDSAEPICMKEAMK